MNRYRIARSYSHWLAVFVFHDVQDELQRDEFRALSHGLLERVPFDLPQSDTRPVEHLDAMGGGNDRFAAGANDGGFGPAGVTRILVRFHQPGSHHHIRLRHAPAHDDRDALGCIADVDQVRLIQSVVIRHAIVCHHIRPKLFQLLLRRAGAMKAHGAEERDIPTPDASSLEFRQQRRNQISIRRGSGDVGENDAGMHPGLRQFSQAWRRQRVVHGVPYCPRKIRQRRHFLAVEHMPACALRQTE